MYELNERTPLRQVNNQLTDPDNLTNRRKTSHPDLHRSLSTIYSHYSAPERLYTSTSSRASSSHHADRDLIEPRYIEYNSCILNKLQHIHHVLSRDSCPP